MDNITKLAQRIWDNCTVKECITEGVDADYDMTENDDQVIVVGEDQCKESWWVELQGTPSFHKELTSLFGKATDSGRQDVKVWNWTVDGITLVLSSRDNTLELHQYYDKVGR